MLFEYQIDSALDILVDPRFGPAIHPDAHRQIACFTALAVVQVMLFEYESDLGLDISVTYVEFPKLPDHDNSILKTQDIPF